MKSKIMNWIFLFVTVFSLEPALAQQSEVAVTVYNQNLALVRDVRTIQINKGEQTVQFQEVAAQIDPTSVHLKSLTAPGEFAVLEQNFEYDLVNPDKILQKYIDNEIELYTAADTLRGVLMNAGNELIVKLPSGEIRMIQKRDIRSINFPKLPEGLITRPTLIWLVKSPAQKSHKIETEYLTKGLTWHAEYVALLNEKETQMDVTAWVSLENTSGATYKNAQLKLVAGEIHLVEGQVQPQYEMAKRVQIAAEAAVSEKEFFEYHLYTVERPTTLNNNQVKQVTLFEAPNVKFGKRYVFDGQVYPDGVRIFTRFKNEEKNNLGMPFPAGKFRVYKKDVDGSAIFLGEDQIEHTPKDEWIEAFLGNAFDIKPERKQTSSRRIGNQRLIETYEISVRNHKKEAVEVVVVEHLQYRAPESEWQISESSLPFEKKDARTVEFKLQVGADKEAKLTYTVDYSW